MSAHRYYSLSDQLCLKVDQALRAVFATPTNTGRIYPAHGEAEPHLTDKQRRHSAGIMRVNHAGEVCAQALYHGQSIVSRSEAVKEKMNHAAIEEGDHLLWCMSRLEELGSHASYLNFLWYLGSFGIGVGAGLISDACSLGFLAETENQVVRHLEKHMTLLPPEDIKSYKILEQMRIDEAVHRDDAIEAGASVLPEPVKKMMSLVSKVMVKVAYWV